MPTSDNGKSNEPFTSPASADASNRDPDSRATAPITLSVILGFVGVFFLLLLNGQYYANMLVFLACLTVSGGLWCRFLVRSPDSDDRRVALLVTAVHIALLIALSTMLPKQYREQRNRNDAIEKLREKHNIGQNGEREKGDKQYE